MRKRCPHCGEGPLFSGWSHLERCSNCGLVFERNPGDTWAFTVIGDRLPIAAIIALIYFGVVRSHPVPGLTMLGVLAVLLVWTAPNRWGAGIALHYLSRVYWPDPADPIPPAPSDLARDAGDKEQFELQSKLLELNPQVGGRHRRDTAQEASEDLFNLREFFFPIHRSAPGIRFVIVLIWRRRDGGRDVRIVVHAVGCDHVRKMFAKLSHLFPDILLE